MPDNYFTKVLFVKDEDNEVTAVFPYEVGTNNPDMMMCYAHLGQHGTCSEDWVKEQELATKEEYSNLLKELYSREYHLEILKSFEWLKSWEFRNQSLKSE